MFYTNEAVKCPICQVELTCTYHNYSGCNVDLAECPECKKRFQVSYKVDSIREITR